VLLFTDGTRHGFVLPGDGWANDTGAT